MGNTWMFWTASTVIAACGFALLAWALFADRSRGRKRCPKCWYSMEQAVSRRCPECGHEAKHEMKLHKTHRRWTWAMASALPLLLAGYLAIQPKVQRDGWGSVMPTTVLIAAMYLNDHEWALPHVKDRMRREHDHPDFADPVLGPHVDTLYQWQWRWVARQAMRNIDKDDLGYSEMRDYLSMMTVAADFSDNNDVRDDVIEALVRLFSDDDPQVQSMALIFATDHRDYEASVQRVLPYLDHEEQRVRTGAVTALWLMLNYDHVHPTPYLIKALDHKCNRVRLYALTALTSRRDILERVDGAKQRIIALRDDPSDEIRERWVRAMHVVLGDPDMRSLQREMFQSDDIALRRGAFGSLYTGEAVPKKFHPKIITALTDDDLRIRQYASSLLTAVPDDVLMEHEARLRELYEVNDPTNVRDITTAIRRIDRIKLVEERAAIARYTSPMTAVRHNITFTGRVQGVFFRATAEKIAQKYHVAGWVRNEPNGSVRMVVEGEPDELDRFIEAVKDAKRKNITAVQIEQADATGEFDGFTVRD